MASPIQFNHVGIVVDQRHREALAIPVQEWFTTHGINATVLHWDSPTRTDLDLVVVMGGDGTVLFALGRFPGCPVVAINFGTVGFLTAANRDELNVTLEKLLKREYIVSERSMLNCVFKNAQENAVNEMVIKGATRLISVECLVNERLIRHIRGDGVIVGTPTGSTAYLLSAGSPIVMPEVRCMILTGLNEYNFSARHLVLNHDSVIRLIITKSTWETDIYCAIDGKSKMPLHIGDEIIIREAKEKARLIFMDKDYFFVNLSSRLTWS